jgi:hypothetical protein
MDPRPITIGRACHEVALDHRSLTIGQRFHVDIDTTENHHDCLEVEGTVTEMRSGRGTVTIRPPAPSRKGTTVSRDCPRTFALVGGVHCDHLVSRLLPPDGRRPQSSTCAANFAVFQGRDIRRRFGAGSTNVGFFLIKSGSAEWRRTSQSLLDHPAHPGTVQRTASALLG